MDNLYRKPTEINVIAEMRRLLQPQGTAPVVYLHLNEHMFDHDFVNKCIGELERMPMRIAMGDGPTALEQLAYILLCDSAYIETNR